jgi:2-polyprenyl-3-methyl-5-hydroxy-6-metoxy-1,4-benzoquinol methylase
MNPPQMLEQLDQVELERIRQQYDHVPYPKTPIEVPPQADYETLYLNSLVTPYYLKYRQVVNTEGKLILDAGCGSGDQAMTLAVANPGAKVIGIDLSAPSIEVAKARVRVHNLPNVEFQVLSIFDLPKLGLEFDYINCDEVLYLLPNPVTALQVLKSVLKPQGIIRTNFDNAYQRAHFLRSQTLFKMLGLMDQAPTETEHQAVTDTMQALKDGVKLKSETWDAEYEHPEHRTTMIGMNHLLMGDRGYTIPDVFDMLQQSELEFLSMVAWRRWEVLDLFKDPEQLPTLWEMGIAYASVEERLRLYELLQPVHRLMDFWCTHSNLEGSIAIDEWEKDLDWQNVTVHLHPHLCHEAIQSDLVACIEAERSFEISQYIKKPTLVPVLVEGTTLACLLPLWQGKQPFHVLTDRYRQLKPLNPITLEPLSEEKAAQEVKQLLSRLNAFLYVLIEK